MNVKALFTKRRIACFLILVVMGIFLFQSDVYVQSVKQGISLYIISVLPATFPFFFFSKLLTELNFARDVAPLAEKPLRFLYRVPPVAGYIAVMSLLCGYPVGARLLSEFFTSGFISKEDAKKISSFTSTGGPIFIIGTVGVAMFGNKAYGFILLLSHYIGTFLNGLLYRGKRKDHTLLPLPGVVGGDLLNKSMTQTLLSLGIVGGFIVLFNLIIDMADNLNVFCGISYLLALVRVPTRLSEGFLFGLIEMTRGCKIVSVLPLPVFITLPCCVFLLTFGGLSVTFQSLTYLSKIKISPAYYLLTKTTQGILSALACFFLSLLIFF